MFEFEVRRLVKLMNHTCKFIIRGYQFLIYCLAIISLLFDLILQVLSYCIFLMHIAIQSLYLEFKSSFNYA
jgi:hypothetical protein